jgi:4-amino-4-deoxy-L-arabinose transferase-like glycosyltransferase
MMRFDWRRLDMATYLAEQRHNPVRSNGGGPNSAAANPPLYYLYADVAYWADSAGNAFDRLYAIRIWNLVLLALTVVAGWLLAGEVFGRARLLQLVCAAIVGLIPMETATAASVSPDALLVGLWTLALWFGVRLIKRPGSSGDAAGLCAVTAAAILTKATSYALVPAVLFALLVWGLRCRAEGREVLRSLGLAVTVLVAPVIAWVELAQSLHRPAINSIAGTGPGRTYPFRFRQLLSYLWQFYFPRLPWLISQRTTEGLPLYEIWVREGWGVFGWLELSMPNWVYAVLTTFTAAVGIRAAGLVVRFRDRVRLSVLVFFALALVSLLAGLHWEEFQSIIQGQGAILQGRYLLPLVGLFGLAVSLVISRLPRRWQGAACGSVLAGLLLVQVVALATVAGRYYT